MLPVDNNLALATMTKYLDNPCDTSNDHSSNENISSDGTEDSLNHASRMLLRPKWVVIVMLTFVLIPASVSFSRACSWLECHC